jgi:uncharacterized protein (TIGR02596 family)
MKIKINIKHGLRAFSLVELLVVLAIAAMMMTVGAVGVPKTIQAMKLTNLGDQLQALINVAQQNAAAEGVTYEMRIYKYALAEDMTTDGMYRGVFVLKYLQAGMPDPSVSGMGQPLKQPLALITEDKLELPNGLVFASNAEISSLLSLNANGQNTLMNIPMMVLNAQGDFEPWKKNFESEEYISILFKPDGTNLPVNGNWFLTIVNQRDEEQSIPASDLRNFYCIQIEPRTGSVMTFRP